MKQSFTANRAAKWRPAERNSAHAMAGKMIILVPINHYMGSTTNFDPVELKTKVTTWVNFEYVRIVVIALGLVTSIVALEFYDRKRGARVPTKSA